MDESFGLQQLCSLKPNKAIGLDRISARLLKCASFSICSSVTKLLNQIQQSFVDFNQLSYTELVIKLMNSQNFSVNSHLLKFVSLSNNDLRNNLLSNHTDDT